MKNTIYLYAVVDKDGDYAAGDIYVSDVADAELFFDKYYATSSRTEPNEKVVKLKFKLVK